MCLARIRKSWGACCAPALFLLSGYGLELTDECGTAIGPSDCSSSERPMHWPELPPVHGMLSTSGSPPGEVWPNSGEFGTRSGVHIPVKVSSDSPPEHAAIVGAELIGAAMTATAGATATATANPPARISRRASSFVVAIVTLSLDVIGRGFALSLPAKPSAGGNITPTTWKTLAHWEEKWCECAISGSLLSDGCGTASTTVAAAP